MTQRSRVWKYAWKVWVVFILFALLIPSSSLEVAKVPIIPYADKIVHFFLFGILYLLVAMASDYHISSSRKNRHLLYVLTFSIFTEFSQFLLGHRSFDIFDIIANIMGAIAAYLFFNRKQN